MARYQLYLEQPGSEVPTRVLLYIHWNGQRLKYPTGCKVLPSHWKEEKQSVTGQASNCRACVHPEVPATDHEGRSLSIVAHEEINRRLEFLRSAAVTSLDRFTKEFSRPPSRSELKATLMKAENKSTGEAPADLFGFISHFLGSAEGQFNSSRKRPFHKATLSRFQVTYKLLQDYVAKRTRRSVPQPIPFSAVDADFVAGFTVFLTDDRKFAVNTVVKYGKTLREFLRRAQVHRQVGKEVDPEVFHRRLGLKEEPSAQIYLTPEELDALYRLDLSARPALERVRDLFIIGAWTGLRFGDLSRLKPEHIEAGRIRIPTAKTGKEVFIPLHPFVREIMDKYDGHAPVAVSNQKQNQALKEIAALVPQLHGRIMIGSTKAGVRREVSTPKWEMVTTHTARRSFASNLYRDGVPARTIMGITGHSTEQVFQRYIRLTNEEHADVLAQSRLFRGVDLKVA